MSDKNPYIKRVENKLKDAELRVKTAQITLDKEENCRFRLMNLLDDLEKIEEQTDE